MCVYIHSSLSFNLAGRLVAIVDSFCGINPSSGSGSNPRDSIIFLCIGILSLCLAPVLLALPSSPSPSSSSSAQRKEGKQKQQRDQDALHSILGMASEIVLIAFSKMVMQQVRLGKFEVQPNTTAEVAIFLYMQWVLEILSTFFGKHMRIKDFIAFTSNALNEHKLTRPTQATVPKSVEGAQVRPPPRNHPITDKHNCWSRSSRPMYTYIHRTLTYRYIHMVCYHRKMSDTYIHIYIYIHLIFDSFTEFDTQPSNDVVQVLQCLDIACLAPLQLAQLSGTYSTPQAFTSYTGFMKIVFTSDSTVNSNGFSASWRLVRAQPALFILHGKRTLSHACSLV